MAADARGLIRREAIRLDGSRGVGQILDLIGDQVVVLLGEATHGTHEFYETRAHLAQALIASRGFNIVALEADWPDAHRASEWVRGNDTDLGGSMCRRVVRYGTGARIRERIPACVS